MKNKLLEKNLNTLKLLNKNIVNLIKDSKDEKEYFTIKENANGLANLLIKQGTKIMSAYDLENDGEKVKNVAEKIPTNKQGCTIIIGMGLGHLANALLEQKEKNHCLIIVEKFPYLIKETFKLHDFSKHIKDGSILFATPTEMEVMQVISMVENFNVINEWNIICEPYVNILMRDYSKLINIATDTINQIRCNVGTVMGNGKAIAQNDIKNLPYIIRHRGVAEYKDIFKDKPAVLVSTGPSLRKNIHLLKKIQDKCIIICVAQAIRILLAYDIRPDFACTVDYGKVNMEHFKGLMNCGIPLIILNRAYAGILKEWSGPKIISTSVVMEKEETIAGFISKKGSLEQGGSVSHMCLGAAINFGCNPIALIGQDLAYENGLSHNQNADASGKVKIDEHGMITWNVDDPNSILKENEHQMGGVLNVEGYFGGLVQTNIGLMSFITSFENIFKTYKDKKDIYNCTEGGAYLKYCTNLYLKDFIKKFCRKKINKKNIDYNTVENENALIKKALKLLDSGMSNLREIEDNCEKGLAAAELAKKNYKNKRKLKKNLADNELYSNKAHEETKKNNLLSIAIYHASRRIYDKDLNVDGNLNHIKNHKKDFLIRIKRNKHILETAMNEADELYDLYEEVYSILEKYQHTKDTKLLTSEVKENPDLDNYQDYFNKGNFAYPLVEARKIIKDRTKPNDALIVEQMAIEMREEQIKKANSLIDNSELLVINATVKKVIELGRDKKFDEALKLLKKIKNKDHEMVLWGTATLYFFTKEIDKSLIFFKRLIEKCPDDLRYQFEYGNVLLNKDAEAGIKHILEVMKKTEQFDHFFKTIGLFYYNKEMWKDAIENYKMYIKKFPADYTVIENIVECWKEIGNIDKIKEWENKLKAFKSAS